MRRYRIDINGLIKLLVKFSLRKPKRLAGLNALTYPIVILWNGFLKFLQDKVYELNKTSQVVHIEAVLNDRWDAGLRRIYLTDGDSVEPLYIYRVAESKPAPIIYQDAEGEPAPYIYTDNELNAVTIDFIIHVPVFITFDEEEMKALVNKYRLPGKAYIIQTF